MRGHYLLININSVLIMKKLNFSKICLMMTLIEYFKEYLKQKLSFKISTFWLFMEGGAPL